MANVCFTSYRLTGPLEELELLCEKLNKRTQQNYIKNGYGKRWLGNILIGCLIDTGVCTKKTAEAEYSRREHLRVEGKNSEDDWPDDFRGNLIDDCCVEDGTLYFDTETAWDDKTKAFEWVIKKLGLSVECWYIAEELANGMYYTNDSTGAIFGEDYDFYVTGTIEAEDSAEGEPECIEDGQMNRKKFIEFCGEILGREIDPDIDDKALESLIRDVEGFQWINEDSYVNVYRLDRE